MGNTLSYVFDYVTNTKITRPNKSFDIEAIEKQYVFIDDIKINNSKNRECEINIPNDISENIVSELNINCKHTNTSNEDCCGKLKENSNIIELDQKTYDLEQELYHLEQLFESNNITNIVTNIVLNDNMNYVSNNNSNNNTTNDTNDIRKSNKKNPWKIQLNDSGFLPAMSFYLT